MDCHKCWNSIKYCTCYGHPNVTGLIASINGASPNSSSSEDMNDKGMSSDNKVVGDSRDTGNNRGGLKDWTKPSTGW